MCRKSILNRYETGANILKNIKKTGLTYDAIAESLDLASSRVIYEWVNGSKMPSTENLVRLSILFNNNLEDILVLENVF